MFRGLEIEQKKRFRRLCLNWGDVDLLQKVVPDDENAGLIVFCPWMKRCFSFVVVIF